MPFRLCSSGIKSDFRGKSQHPQSWNCGAWKDSEILTLGSNSSCPWQNCSLFAEHNVWLKHSLFSSLPAICEPDSGSQTHYPEADRKGNRNGLCIHYPEVATRYICTFVCCSVVCKWLLVADAVFVQSPRAGSSQSSLPGRLDH